MPLPSSENSKSLSSLKSESLAAKLIKSVHRHVDWFI
jgi:hypothetical protein